MKILQRAKCLLRRVLPSILALLLVMPQVLPQAFAADDGVTQQMVDHAYALHALNLFQGDEGGFSLHKRATRTEGLVMLIRLMGEESTVKSGSYPHAFTDVPTWGSKYVGYAYSQGITKGNTPTNFGATEYITANQYCTFVLRALGYSDTQGDFVWSAAAEKAASLGVVTQAQIADWKQDVFIRGDMADISYAALTATKKGSSQTLCQELVNKGVFTEDAAKLAGVWTAGTSQGTIQPGTNPETPKVDDQTQTTVPKVDDQNQTTTPKTDEPQAQGPLLNTTTAVCPVGGKVTLTANRSVVWSSSDTTVATVSSAGVVTGVKAGKATITAKDTSGMTGTVTVTVQQTTVAVQSVSLNKTSLTLTAGGSETLTATVSPSNASNRSVTWASSNTAVATVSGGTVKAVKAGSATITATASDSSGKKATASVTVKEAAYEPKAISVSEGWYYLGREGKCMDIAAGGTEDYTQVGIYEENGTNAQKFKIVNHGNNTISFIAGTTETERALDINPIAVGTHPIIFARNNTDCQKFKIFAEEDHNFTIRLAADTTLVLAEGSNGVVVQKYDGSWPQKWAYVSTTPPELGYNTDLVSHNLEVLQQTYPDGYSLGSNYSYDSAWQCFGFAIEVQNRLFGNRARWRYDGTPTSNMTMVGRLDRGQYSRDNIINLINQACPGDVIQFDGYSGEDGHQHSMTYVWRSADGFGVYDANWGGGNVVRRRSCGFSDFQNAQYAHISLLRNVNYPMK